LGKLIGLGLKEVGVKTPFLKTLREGMGGGPWFNDPLFGPYFKEFGGAYLKRRGAKRRTLFHKGFRGFFLS